jgi:hypothetical protein
MCLQSDLNKKKPTDTFVIQVLTRQVSWIYNLGSVNKFEHF